MPAVTDTRTPPAEVTITVPLVRALLSQHHIDTTQRPVALLDEGWDNTLFTVAPGSHPDRALRQRLVVRLPRRAVAVPLLAHEQRWLPTLVPDSPLPIPRPLRIGSPGQGYPWPFSVLPWLPGVASDLAPADSEQAPIYADFLAALHQAPAADAPHNPYRGVPLANRQDGFEARWTRRQSTLQARQRLRALWQDALAAPPAQSLTWIHGDPHARNLLVHQGRISGVIDWGDLCAGDRATDLSAFWMHFHEPGARRTAIARYQLHHPTVTAATWLRARGWALLFGMMFIDTGLVDHPRHLAMGQRTLNNLIADESA